MAEGQTIDLSCQVEISFQLAHQNFTEIFLALPFANSIILGIPFFKKRKITILSPQNLFQFNDLTVQLNEIKPKSEPKRLLRQKKIPFFRNKNTTIMSNEHSILEYQ